MLHYHHHRSLKEAKGPFQSWSEQYINLGYATGQTMILPNPIDDDVKDDQDTEIDMEQIHYEEWILAASMGPNVVFIEDVQLRMRDLDILHNWAEDLDRYSNIEIDRKWVHTHLCRGQEQTVEPIYNTIVFSLHQLSNE